MHVYYMYAYDVYVLSLRSTFTARVFTSGMYTLVRFVRARIFVRNTRGKKLTSVSLRKFFRLREADCE